MPDDEQAISLSTLRAELIALELRIVDRLTVALAVKADAMHVEQLDTRLTQLEIWRAGRERTPETLLDHDRRIGKLERYRYAIPSAALLSLGIAALALINAFIH